MTPAERCARLQCAYDPSDDPLDPQPDPFPRPDRLSGWLAVGLWTLAALVAGGMMAWGW